MSKVKLDLNLCNGFGHCVVEAPEYFDLEYAAEKAVQLKEDVAEADRAAIDTAIVLCPVAALSWVDQ
jgi:ferredoxin